jgi:hypothetical protein
MSLKILDEKWGILYILQKIINLIHIQKHQN